MSPETYHLCVLLVDDEPMIRNAGRRLLNRIGCRVLLAEDGRTALDVFQNKKADIDFVILDLGMPGMDGVECLDGLLGIDPDAQVVISTGCSEGDQGGLELAGRVAGLLPKPYDANQLRALFRELMAPPSR